MYDDGVDAMKHKDGINTSDLFAASNLMFKENQKAFLIVLI